MKKIKLILNMTVMLLPFLMISSINAAGLSIRASKTTAYVGDTVVITVSTNDPIGSCSVSSSNTTVASFAGDTSCGFQSPSGQITYSLKIKSVGTTTITLSPTNMASVSSESRYTTSSSVTINVIAKPVVVLSSDNSLSSLGVEGKELSPAFDKDTLEYSVELEPETTSVNVLASPSHGGAGIAGAGTREVVDGENRLEIVVTAENGSSRTYVINASVKEYNPIKQIIDDKEYTVVRKRSLLTAPENYEETTVTIDGEEVPAYVSEVTKYTLVGLKNESGNINLYVYKDGKYTLYSEYTFNKVKFYPLEMKTSDIPDGYSKTTITYNDKKLVAYKMNEASNFAILYGMNIETGEVHIYMYDEEEDTLQIYNDEEVKNLEEELKQMKLIISILFGGCALLFVLCIIVGLKKGKNNKNKDDSYIESVDDIKVTEIQGTKISRKDQKKILKAEHQRKVEEEKKSKKEAKVRARDDARKLKEELKLQKRLSKKKNKEIEDSIDIRDI